MTTDVDFDCAELGRAVVTLAVISKLMGHSGIICTARDYLFPHREEERTPEWQFLLALLVEGPDAVLSDEQAISALQAMDLPPINA